MMGKRNHLALALLLFLPCPSLSFLTFAKEAGNIGTRWTKERIICGRSSFSFVFNDRPQPTLLQGMVSPDVVVNSGGRGDAFELAKTAVIVLMFGGGLIPAALAANKMMLDTMTGKRAGGDDSNTKYNPSDSLDPYVASGKQKRSGGFVPSSGATGPKLPYSSFLFAQNDIPLADIIAIVGRIPNLDSVADWKNLPSTKLEGTINPDKPIMWLPRATFKENVRTAPFKSWPVDAKTGQPVGGEKLQREEEGRIRQRRVLIGDAALDAVFDTWAWGASIATPDKVQSQLKEWRPSGEKFDLGKFTGAALRGRSITGLGIVTFIVIQTVVYGSLFIAPFLRVFFDIDIGFGEMGSCGVDGCTKFF